MCFLEAFHFQECDALQSGKVLPTVEILYYIHLELFKVAYVRTSDIAFPCFHQHARTCLSPPILGLPPPSN